MIRLAGLRFGYADGPFHLDVPDLRVERGERLAVVGPSGSGKTTLLRLIAGILEPDAGQVTVDGNELAGLADSARRRFRIRNIGLVFQEFELLEYLSVLDNALLPHHLDGALPGRGEARERARQLLAGVGLADKLDRLPARLSQGERQRVAVCRALVTRPRLVLADEPTGNLDATTGTRVLEELIAFAASDEATLLVVTHDRSLLDRFDRVVDVTDYAREPATP